MAKFDGIRMQDLVEVKDPDEEGGLTLIFKDNKLLFKEDSDLNNKFLCNKKLL